MLALPAVFSPAVCSLVSAGVVVVVSLMVCGAWVLSACLVSCSCRCGHCICIVCVLRVVLFVVLSVFACMYVRVKPCCHGTCALCMSVHVCDCVRVCMCIGVYVYGVVCLCITV